MNGEQTADALPDALLALLGDWLRRARSLAAQVGSPDAVDAASRLLGEVDRRGVRVVVVGGPHAGKSRAINRYLGSDVLPVSAIAGAVEIVIEPAAEGEETVSVGGGPSRPLAQAAAVFKSAPAGRAPVIVRLSRPQLVQNDLTLVESRLDAAEGEIPAIVDRLLSAGDAAVVILDAHAAMRRTDRLFLEECGARGLPTIVVVAKADQVPPEEKDDLFAFIEGNLADPNRTPVVSIPDAGGGVGEFDAALGGLIASLDPPMIRARLVAFSLQRALEGLLATASAAGEHRSSGELERDEAVRRRQLDLGRAELGWEEIQIQLGHRRQNLDEMLRRHLVEQRESIVEALLYELERSSDIKSWWERDLPYRLKREMRTVGSQLTGTANRQIVADARWLQEEIQRRFSHPFPAVLDASVRVDAETPELAGQTLSDGNVLKILSRIGTGAAVLAAGTLFAAAGVGGLALASSIGAGLVAEQLIRLRTNQDRAVVRGQLETVIAQAELSYAEDVSRKLREGYDRVLDVLRERQARWQEDQLRALREFADRPADPKIATAAKAEGPLRDLANEVRAALGAA